MIESMAFFVLSSKGDDVYQVSVHLHTDSVICTCDCPAGKFGKICKHKISILSGDGHALARNDQLPLLNSLSGKLFGSEVRSCLRELNEADNALSSAKKNFDDAKRKLERLIHD